ncbi:hypothetical protein G9C98_005798 [Cotesia typhae]|uniref:Adenosine kinase n=1 Tax=Cotesia typhae TaxID=2053667 RepID=A0A8J5QWJ3_9HYME|nr:hypothetical protein G9C98_005798 [Cotesia typhae]
MVEKQSLQKVVAALQLPAVVAFGNPLLDVVYALHLDLPTGIALSLSRDSSRSLIANLGAAGVYTLEDLKKSNLPWETIKIVYIEGFFLTHALAKALNIKFDNVADIPFLLNSSKRVTVGVSSTERSKDDWLADNDIFVITQGGSAPAIVVWGQGNSVQVQPTKPPTPVVDATGAGDALVAGFLAGVLSQWDPKSCLECGCKTAGMMVTRLGVTLPDVVPEDLLK